MTVAELINALQKLDENAKAMPVLIVGDYEDCKKIQVDIEYNVVILSKR